MAAKAFVSKAQIEKMKGFVAEGKISQQHFDECLAATPDPDKLPERLHPKKEPKKDPDDIDFGSEPK